MERPVETFFYGLFMDADALREKGLHPTNVRQASLRGVSLRIGDRATLVSDPGGHVYGILMSMPRAELERLHSEPGLSAYRVESVNVKLADGSSVSALCFNLPGAPESHQANPEYAAKLKALARRLGLPEDYIERIR